MPLENFARGYWLVHDPNFKGFWFTWTYQSAQLILYEAFTPDKGVSFGKMTDVYLKVPGDGVILVYLGSLFQCLNTLTVNSVWLVSHLIFSDLELHPSILAMTYFSYTKEPSCSHWFSLEYICVLWSSCFSGFLLIKETDQAHCEAFSL